MVKRASKEYTYEFIGNEIEVVDCCCEEYEGIEGQVVDETKNMFVISDGKERKIPKKCNRFEVDFNGKSKVLDGKKLTYRPEDRIKKLG